MHTCLGTILSCAGLKRRDPGGVRYLAERWTTLEKSKIASLIAANPGYSTSAILETLVQQLGTTDNISGGQPKGFFDCSQYYDDDARQRGPEDAQGRQAILDCLTNREDMGLLQLAKCPGGYKNTWCVACKRSNVKAKEGKELVVLKLRLSDGGYVPKAFEVEPQIRKWWKDIFGASSVEDNRTV
ncbi:TXNDC12 [Lepeophtheirus salmonis]|uniref:TXNDC12 n=1 Tax=Lepeophtheirus salmonis TaxID=72036 RepID=A0A817FC05_LEPSM|nr:TXNDC12 [Lepeophtheirus salmonis]